MTTVSERITDPHRRSLLAPTGNEAAERAAIADEPRPGTLLGGEDLDDSVRRTFTQDETDGLIRSELVARASPSDRDEMLGICGEPRALVLLSTQHPALHVAPVMQRGGIDSDPLVRLLAFRAWGDRDRRWFEDRGGRKGDPIALIDGGPADVGPGLPYSEVALAWSGERVIGVAETDAHPGSAVEVQVDHAAVDGMAVSMLNGGRRDATGKWLWTLRVSRRLRIDPEQPGPLPGRSARRKAAAKAATAMHDPMPRLTYRFERLQIQRDPLHGHATVTAEQGGHRAQVRIDHCDFAKGGSAGVWHRCFARLADEFRRLGATPDVYDQE